MKALKCDKSKPQECQQKKNNIGERYVNKVNVEGDVDMVIRAAVGGGVFTDSILSLTAESSGCDVKRSKADRKSDGWTRNERCLWWFTAQFPHKI